MEPISVNADGSGRFKIKYGEIAATMAALSEAGPFLWSEDGVKNVLLVSDATDFLWHRRTPVPAPHATIRFMTCTLHQ